MLDGGWVAARGELVEPCAAAGWCFPHPGPLPEGEGMLDGGVVAARGELVEPWAARGGGFFAVLRMTTGGTSLTLALSQGERECWMGVVGRSW